MKKRKIIIIKKHAGTTYVIKEVWNSFFKGFYL